MEHMVIGAQINMTEYRKRDTASLVGKCGKFVSYAPFHRRRYPENKVGGRFLTFA